MTFGAADLKAYRFLGLLGRSEDYPPKVGRYQDYDYFAPVSLADIRRAWKKTLGLIRRGRAPREAGVYLHWPFCLSHCTYCYCSMTVTRSRREISVYVDMLRREMDNFRDLFEGFEFSSFYIGGGTPTYAPDDLLDALLGHMRASFALAPGAQFYVEAAPSSMTPGKMEVLLKHGVNRITLGIQSMDPKVLGAVDRRGQDRRTVERAFALMKAAPDLITDIDLIYGGPGQTRLSFLKDVAWAVRRGPDVVHLYGFEPRRQTVFSREGGEVGSGHFEELRLCARGAEKLLAAAGYRTSQWDPDEKKREPLEEVQDSGVRNLGSSVLGFGRTAKSHAFGSAWYEHRPVRAGEKIATGRVPRYFALLGGADEEMRGYVVRNLCRFGKISRSAFRAHFGRELDSVPGLNRAVRELCALGKTRDEGDGVALNTVDPVDRLIWTKHLYSRKLVSALMRKHAARYRRFLDEGGRDPGRWAERLSDTAARRSFVRVFYRSESASRSTRARQ